MTAVTNQSHVLYELSYVSELCGLSAAHLLEIEETTGWPISYRRPDSDKRLYDPEDLTDLKQLARMIQEGHRAKDLIRNGHPVWRAGGPPVDPFKATTGFHRRRLPQPTTTLAIDLGNQATSAMGLGDYGTVELLLARGVQHLSAYEFNIGLLSPIALMIAAKDHRKKGISAELRELAITIDHLVRPVWMEISSVSSRVCIRKPKVNLTPLAHALCLALRLRKITASVSLTQGLPIKMKSTTDRVQGYLAETIPVERILDPRAPLPRQKLGI